MTSDKEIQLLDSLSDKDYREALAVEHVNTTIAVQIRNMRENHQWDQIDLANCLGKHQEAVSRWENPDYGRHSITTLKALASAFDVALLVKFVPFSELVKDMVNLSETRLSPPSFNEEQSSRTWIASLEQSIDANQEAYPPTPSMDANLASSEVKQEEVLV